LVLKLKILKKLCTINFTLLKKIKIFLECLARVYCMQPPKSKLNLAQRNLLSSGLLMMGGNKNVPNADKFEKFEMLKERFITYRENVLKIGFDNIIKKKKLNPSTSSCQNIHMAHLSMQLKLNSLSHVSLMNFDLKELNKNNKCPCSFCSYCIEYQHLLTELAYLNSLEQDIKEIRNYLRDTRKKLEQKELKTKLANDWKQMALVLDRTFFFIYLVITFVTLIILSPSGNPMDTKSSTSSTSSSPSPSSDSSAVINTSSNSHESNALLNTISDAMSPVTASFQDQTSAQSGYQFF
jgi:hypothetical protein